VVALGDHSSEGPGFRLFSVHCSPFGDSLDTGQILRGFPWLPLVS